MGEQQALNAFCAYSGEDLALWEELRCHLSVLDRQGLIASWYTWKCGGEKRSEEVRRALSNAQIIVWLINPQSPFVSRQSDELREAAKMGEEGAALVFPILSSEGDIYQVNRESLPIFKLSSFFPSEARALISWKDREEALCAHTRYILSFARSYQAIRSLPKGRVERLNALHAFEAEARQRALGEWSEYQVWNEEREHGGNEEVNAPERQSQIPLESPTDKKNHEIRKGSIQPEDNDLMANEARILTHLRASEGYEELRHFISQLIDSFFYQEETTGIVRRVNVLTYIEGLYSLQEVRAAYPDGIDPKDMVWIWRRLLIALSFAHTNKVIHGSVIPPHIMIHPEEHGVVLVGWAYAVLNPSVTEERISAISGPYREWYPAEVLIKDIPTLGLDICMAAKCMIYLLGGDPHKRTMPDTVPWRIQSYLKGCTPPNPQRRPQDAHKLLEAFDELIEQLWGPKTFRKFIMPEQGAGSSPSES